MARRTIGFYWDRLSIQACVVRSTLTEVTMEKVVKVWRDLEGHDESPSSGLVDDMKRLIQTLGMSIDTCIACVPERNLMYRVLHRPFSDKKKIAETLVPEVEGLLPQADGRLFVDFVTMGKDETGQTVLCALSAREPAIEASIAGVRQAGLEAEIMDAPSCALVAGMRNCFDLRSDTHYVVMHMGWDDTSICILNGKSIKHLGGMPYGLGIIVDEISRDRSIDAAEVEQLIRQGEVLDAGPHAERFVKDIGIILSRLGIDVEDTVIIPTGYALCLSDITDHLSRSLGVSIELPELSGVPVNVAMDELLGSFLAVSLALRGIDTRDAINFRQDELAFTKRIEEIRGNVLHWMKFLAFVFLLWLSGLGLDVYMKSKLIHRMDDKIKKEFVSVMPKGTPVVGLDVYMKSKLIHRMDDKIKKEFVSVMPKGTPIVEPVGQMERYLKDQVVKSSGSARHQVMTPLELLHDISGSVPTNMEITLKNLSMDQDSISISGTADSYKTVEKLKEIVSKIKYISSVKIVYANVDKLNKLVRFKLMCSKGKQGI